MRTILVLIVSLIVIGFKPKFQNLPNHHFGASYKAKQDSINYKVYKIDSINNWYLIYAKRGHKVFKIVSRKEQINVCNKIIVNKVYKFKLHSMLTANGRSIIPANQKYEISGWRVDNLTTINFEGDSIRDLFYADNIKSLCIDSR